MGKRTDRSTRPPRRIGVRRRLLVEHLGDRRVLAAITGSVFEDVNFSFHKDAEEASLGSRLVYIDTNDNATLDTGERFVVAQQDGTFAFTDLDDGSYLLRLFNGTSSQQQTSPVEAIISGDAVQVSGNQLLLGDGSAIALTNGAVVIGDLETGIGHSISVASHLTKMQSLPDGKLLVIGTDDQGGDTAWIVDPLGDSASPVDLAGNGQPIRWSDIAIDGQGYGVLVEDSDTLSTIHAINATDQSRGIQISTTATTVPSDTHVLSSETGTRSVLAWSSGDGMQLSLWSNMTATPISETPIHVADTSEMLAYDDASGLLVLRTFDGGVSVRDVNQNFASLHTLSDVTGPVGIDGARDLLITVSPIDAMLRLIDIRDGELIADLALDLSTVGQVVSLAMGDTSDTVVLLGAAGMAEVALNRAAANRVQVEGGQDVDSVLFGVSLRGINSAPTYNTLPDLSTAEDTGFSKPAPAALAGTADSPGAIDAEGDRFVLIQVGPAAHGTAAVSINGAITYTPDDNFFGTDTVPVMLHDGRDVSAPFDLQIDVTPTPDPPQDVIITTTPVPENIPRGTPVATIDVIDVDLNDDHLILVHNGRFQEQNGQIIFVGDYIDFETEPLILIDISVVDLETGTSIERTVTLRVQDENDPITAIMPTVGSVVENVLGDTAVVLAVEDQDSGQTHEFTVDDDRFVMDGLVLRLAPNVSVNFEAEPEILVNVTATDGEGSSFTQEITIHVLDVSEQPQFLTLSNDTVMELEPGDVVGEVIVDGAPPNQLLVLTVDDPRFEIDGNTLKLVDGQFVERAAQEEIQLSITADDSQGEFTSISETFVIRVMENETPFHNDNNPYDVNQNGEVTSFDALLVVNYLNTYGPGPVGKGDPGFGYDVNGDGYVTALDALLILNELARLHGHDGTVGSGEAGEGEQPPADSQGGAIANNQDNVIANSQGKVVANSQDGLIPNTAPPQPLPAGNSGRQEIFDQWGVADEKFRDSAVSAPVTPPNSQLTPTPGQATSPEEFAESVDQTLRLLSDLSR